MELCHSLTHTESDQKIHECRTLNTPTSSFGVRDAVNREISKYFRRLICYTMLRATVYGQSRTKSLVV